jgi:hypothetical protein
MPSVGFVARWESRLAPQCVGALGWIDSRSWCADTSAMGVRTRGLNIKAGAAKLKADRAARAEAELVADRWNRRLTTGRDMLWSPTIRAALLAGTPWLDVGPECRRRNRHRCGYSPGLQRGVGGPLKARR